MKINTDGVILGAVACRPNAHRILDVGTGTGVIALMLAQRHPKAHIDALDIDGEASERAAYNFRQSMFSDRLLSIHSDFRDHRVSDCYDLIVSNPPFYTNSLHNPDPRKQLAKHTDSSFFENLFDFVKQYLSIEGQFYCILPVALAQELLEETMPSRALFLQQKTMIASYPGQDPIRTLLVIGKTAGVPVYDTLVIYERQGEHTDAYKALLNPYFLAF
ncbi:tRNA1(Val) (adenine(37)-N6)-methyltransferase [Sphingobacterium griseoflavum]|uniref:tRNA1(Val) (Adenine(37)-N6)-methyltransferase n=2 Tax=Sphingobacterium griseoflavum TaxID=1474952 RepID=A0ABQ3HR35_9SPHI|nr:tRNA1(Val) (adenine(37)-N6)-methyltransferase [Sphingobacterium griseoflavum]